jgi:hypothetical protein
MLTRDDTEARTYALLEDLEDLSEALMEMISVGLTGTQEPPARDVVAALQRATSHATELANPEAHNHSRLQTRRLQMRGVAMLRRAVDRRRRRRRPASQLSDHELLEQFGERT